MTDDLEPCPGYEATTGVHPKPALINGIIDSDDPHIAAYLKLRQAVLNGELQTREEIAAYAAELRRDLPEPAPPPSIAAFIAADIKITFPLLTDQLWTPRPR